MGKQVSASWLKRGHGTTPRGNGKGASPHPVPPKGRPEYPGLEKPRVDPLWRLEADLCDDRTGSLRTALLDTVLGRPGRNGLHALECSLPGSVPKLDEVLELLRNGLGEHVFRVRETDVAAVPDAGPFPRVLVVRETHVVFVTGDADPRELLATMMLHAAHRHGGVVVCVSPRREGDGGQLALASADLGQVASILEHFARKL